MTLWRCVCGASCHVDGEFAYYVQCAACRRVYASGIYIQLVELTPEQAAYAAMRHPPYCEEGGG